MALARLTDPITALKGIGAAKEKQFAALGVYTVYDLITHFPRAYEDRTRLVTIDRLEADVPGCFRAMVTSNPRTSHIRQGLDITKVQVSDHTARLNLTFFNQRFRAEQLIYGEEYYFYGAVSGDFIGYNMQNPVFESIDSPPLFTRRILPIYPLTAGLSNTAVTKAVAQAIETAGAVPEVLPLEIRQAYDILSADRAYFAIHQPQSFEELAQAKKRLIFEEFFIFSAGLSLMRARRAVKTAAPYANTDLQPFYDALPFQLTGAQRRTIDEILGDFRRGVPMNRLVQGDVGSGKTMVAAAAAYCACKNGRQAALMVPTEILAEQHMATLDKLLSPLGLRCGLLTGSMTPAKKRETRAALENGAIDFVIGTHALVSEATKFQNLGLVITDEQHRFGVGQRGALGEKGENPHLLVMSATPIPRTLALILYGDLDVSVIDELPPGREAVDTFLVGENMRARINAFIRKHVKDGHQCFIVCPAVEESETLSVKSAELWAETLQKTVFPDLRVSLLHGQMKSAEKEAVMGAFARGEFDILVATTVIEVGVDVPNATLMIIEDADRFGLSQLHQLRGRVGRGKAKSYCVLFTNSRSAETLLRLKALCKTNDGFQIAQEDLQLRGPGDFFGQRQHGLPVFRVANLDCDLETLKLAQEASARWIESHGGENTPEAAALRQRIGMLFETGNPVLN
jgi:ATP-dependent DNA helicase RecG